MSKMAWSSRLFTGGRIFLQAANTTAATPKSKPVSATAAGTKKNPVATGKSIAEKKKRTINPSAGILKLTPVSPALGDFLGVHEVARTDAVKKIWDYIKSNGLQNPSNKREILCDEKLKLIFNGKDKVGFLEVAKLLAPHFVKAA